MALNQAHWNGGVLIHAGEWILLFCDGVEFKLEGNDEAAFKGTKKGRLYLTSHRVIFINKDAREILQSFAVPFNNLGSVDIDQPIFGANAIKGNIKALPGGNWNGTAQFRLSFSSGGAIEFGQAMLQAAKLASRNPPPPYTPPQMDGNNFYHAPPPAYMSQQDNIDGMHLPREKFPSAPPAQDVWITDQPPPYASIYAQQSASAAGGYYNAPPPAGAVYPNFNSAPGYPPATGPYPPAGAVYPGQQGQYPPTGYANYNEPPPVYPGPPNGKR
ncbi:putative WW domain-binding protein 2 [Hypsibius exemplaris]|uniref:WW domain-binding protein 2 n=1 Tax=Hypsibius exemplaris TaxID=2072580 RepID=A0A1W0X7E3_HYPEX|nr:putative WW domain-binding protein 2 [Hypsibius exemplaris]